MLRPRGSADGGVFKHEPAPVKAMLGPTNTGKTHRAVEAMLQHETGMIGLPLRLLAREIYDRITAAVGEQAVALVTGEEKRVPRQPRYWVCTVEAMPSSRPVDFLAVDEIQLAGHRERGHVFTDRLLGWRGRRETWFMGAETMRPLVERLVPTAFIEGRPRLSTLRGAGSLPLGALPPRTAVVAFSAGRVYELAERLRARRGGAAVVLGALSPRARNAQVALYQSGEVDYMVATDAIGMGLNMDVDCVAFADLRKFDGRQTRELEDAELAQIAGRAGRRHNDGRFATMEPLPPLPADVNRAIERHHFPVQERIYWRNRDLDLSSVPALIASLRSRPPASCLQPVDEVEDFRALLRLRERPEVVARTRSPERVALLWDVCQVPDFRQLQLDDHYDLLAAVYDQLTGPHGRLDADWIEGHVTHIDNMRGDIDTLLMRMAFIRTWTYITHRADWLQDATGWQERTRDIEDRLSDALHAQLVARFVDASRPPTRSRRARPATVGNAPGRSLADQLSVLARDLTPAPAVTARAPQEIDELVAAPHERFRLDDDGRFVLDDRDGRVIGKLISGPELLRPEVMIVMEPDPGPAARLRLQRRLHAWSRDLIATVVPRTAGRDLSAAARGLVYLVEQGLGTVRWDDASTQMQSLTRADRHALRQLGIRVGRHVVWTEAALRPGALRARRALCQAYLGAGARLPRMTPELRSLLPLDDVPDETYAALGFPVFGGRAIRADLVDDLADRITRGLPVAAVARQLQCRDVEASDICEALGGGGGRRPHHGRVPVPRRRVQDA